jgi:hypothetical protein
MPLWESETGRLRRALPPDVHAVLDGHEQAATTSSPEYQEAMMVFYRRHVCRLNPWPECLLRSFTAMEADPRVYQAMCGPSEFHITGSLRDWDVTPRLGEIKIPTLVISGEHDEATPAITKELHLGIAGSKSVIMSGCSHMCHLEQPDITWSIFRASSKTWRGWREIVLRLGQLRIGAEGLSLHQSRRQGKVANAGSRLTSCRTSNSAWAASSRSKGSRWACRCQLSQNVIAASFLS